MADANKTQGCTQCPCLHKPKCRTPCSGRYASWMREVVAPCTSHRVMRVYTPPGSLHQHASLLGMNVSSSAHQHRHYAEHCRGEARNCSHTCTFSVCLPAWSAVQSQAVACRQQSVSVRSLGKLSSPCLLGLHDMHDKLTLKQWRVASA